MLFRNHKKGFVLAEVTIALAVVGILLTAILQLQLTVSQRVVFNTQTCHTLLELKKNLYHSFIKEDKQNQPPEQKSSIKKLTIAALEKYKCLIVQKINSTWQVLKHTKEVEFIFISCAPEEKNEE